MNDGIKLPYKWMLSFALILMQTGLWASSHREAPLIANDPLADNTDVYAFRSPKPMNTILIIATYKSLSNLFECLTHLGQVITPHI